MDKQVECSLKPRWGVQKVFLQLVDVMLNLLIFCCCVCATHHSAWDLLTNQEISIEALVSAFPGQFGFLEKNPAVAKRVEIESKYLRYSAMYKGDIVSVRSV